MVRTALIALAVVLASSVAGCKSKSGTAAKKTTEAEKPAPPEPQVPVGKVAVQLPTVHSDHARRVHSATAFVTIAKDGALAQGKLAAGADPYAGTPHDPTRTFEEELFAGAGAGAGSPQPGPPPPPDPTTQDDPPPPEPDDPDVAPVRPQGQYKMKRPHDDDAQLARQQAIDAARNAGILGAVAADDVNIYGGLLGGGPPTYAYAELDTKAGAVDVLILADRDATARSAVLVLDQLTAHKAGLAVDGGDAPDALPFRFKQELMPSTVAAVVTFTEGSISVTVGDSLDSKRIPRSAAVDVAKLVSTLRPTPMTPVTSQVHVELDDKTTVQELADVLAACAAVGAPSVRLQSNDLSEMYGGFGFGTSGFGPGGGGTGWGTIGTGNYGTIGKGAGTGTGYGVGGGRGGTGSGPKVSIGQPNATGDLDKAIIRRYIKRNIAKITYCYEKELLAKPDLEGTVKVQFFINPQGLVETSTATGVDGTVASCVAGVIQAIEFPKPKGGGGVQVNYPFTFRPTD